MTVLHTGSTKKFASGWESIFDKSAAKNAAAKKSAAKKASPAAGKPAAKGAPKLKKKAAGADKKPVARKKAKKS